MIIRQFKKGDENALWHVFYSAIHRVCSKDYSAEQVNAWAPHDLDTKLWASKMQSIRPFVVELNGKIVGYADLQDSGLIDHFFVHADFQRCGVGRFLMSEILNRAPSGKRLYSEVSHTARPFYEKFGFSFVKEQRVNIRNVILTNNIMEYSGDS